MSRSNRHYRPPPNKHPRFSNHDDYDRPDRYSYSRSSSRLSQNRSRNTIPFVKVQDISTSVDILPSEQWNPSAQINNLSVDKPQTWDFLVSCLKKRPMIEACLEQDLKKQKREDLSDLVKDLIPLWPTTFLLSLH